MPGPDDLEALKAERAAADRAYNEALTRLDRAIQQLPKDFPHAPPGPDEQQITPLNSLWKIGTPASNRASGWIVSAVRRMVAPLFEQQQAFNAAVVEHLNRSVPPARDTRAAVAATQDVLRQTIEELIRFQSLLVMFLQQITPYVDTRDRDVAGVIRGLSGAINAVADEVLRRSEAATARERRHEARIETLEAEIAALRARLDEAARVVGARRPDHA